MDIKKLDQEVILKALKVNNKLEFSYEFQPNIVDFQVVIEYVESINKILTEDYRHFDCNLIHYNKTIYKLSIKDYHIIGNHHFEGLAIIIYLLCKISRRIYN